MLDGPSVVAALRECGITHVVWIPDSEIGSWEPALKASPDMPLIRVCREGEAIAVAAGLLPGRQTTDRAHPVHWSLRGRGCLAQCRA